MLAAVDDYRDLLRRALLDKKQRFGRLYTFQRMADACRVQKTYLSRVLRGNGHLSRDQLYLACGFLGLSTAERKLVSLLHARQRSTLLDRQKALTEEIDQCRARLDKTERYLKAKPPESRSVDLSLYYLDPDIQLVHVFLSIPRFRKAPLTLAERLGLPKAKLARALESLESMGLIQKKSAGYEPIVDTLHLSPDSPLYPAWRLGMRMRALVGLQRADASAYGFSVVFAADERTRSELKRKFLEWISEAQERVQGAPSEEVYQMNFDLFGW